ncbi:MAG: hypothetical protein Q7T11_00210 [Deltaproteobacteria bacterium]|nr:hypothetical protein [Deltaproteobacteria bacterium]
MGIEEIRHAWERVWATVTGGQSPSAVPVMAPVVEPDPGASAYAPAPPSPPAMAPATPAAVRLLTPFPPVSPRFRPQYVRLTDGTGKERSVRIERCSQEEALRILREQNYPDSHFEYDIGTPGKREAIQRAILLARGPDGEVLGYAVIGLHEENDPGTLQGIRLHGKNCDDHSRRIKGIGWAMLAYALEAWRDVLPQGAVANSIREALLTGLRSRTFGNRRSPIPPSRDDWEGSYPSHWIPRAEADFIRSLFVFDDLPPESNGFLRDQMTKAAQLETLKLTDPERAFLSELAQAPLGALADYVAQMQLVDYARRNDFVTLSDRYRLASPFLTEVAQKLKRVPYEELALDAIEMVVDLTRLSPNESFIFEQMETILSHLETALGKKVRLVVKDEDKNRLTLRFLSPRLVEAALRHLHGDRFREFLYAYEVVDPDLMQRGAHTGSHAIGLTLRDLPWWDTITGIPVPAFFFTWHDIYHAADKILGPSNLLRAANVMYRALASLPAPLRHSIPGRFLAKELIDLERHDGLTSDEFYISKWIRIHAFFTLSQKAIEDLMGPEKAAELFSSADPEERSYRAFRWFASHLMKNNDNPSITPDFIERNFNINHVPDERLVAYREFTEAYRNALLADPYHESAADLIWYLQIVLDVISREQSVRKGYIHDDPFTGRGGTALIRPISELRKVPRIDALSQASEPVLKMGAPANPIPKPHRGPKRGHRINLLRSNRSEPGRGEATFLKVRR